MGGGGARGRVRVGQHPAGDHHLRDASPVQRCDAHNSGFLHGIRRPFCFEQALARLREHHLAFDPARGEGVVLYADAPSDGCSWRYAVISADADGVGEWDARLSQAVEFETT
ncbi:peptide ligase PGM1-related protein [Streptomyces sp. NPDC020794]|uniref:peptide ligase PGM1-related protein n=1 Tax=unclassified Streptomyces TaxID=2593676 RepID=UPI0036F0C827